MAAYAALLSLAQTTLLITNQYKYNLSIRVPEDVKSINEYVIFMLSFLDDFPEKANRWEDRIRDVAHKIRDIIEYFMVQKTQSEFIPGLKYGTEEIGQIAGQMMEERPAYLPAAADSLPSPRSSNNAVIGLEDDLLAIKERLCGDPSKLEVIPVVGMAGIGKTTLARTVYEDPLILEYFDIHVWVVVSQDYTPRKILLALFDSIRLLEESGDKSDESEEGEEDGCGNLEKHVRGEKIDVATKIYQSLKGRRYLVVMDDVWSTKVLDDVRNIFPDDKNGSRIMFTTRLSDVADYPGPYSHSHEMQLMDDEQSWILLKNKVLSDGDCPHELEGVGKEIARRCAGLPLAVVLVAGVLLSAVNTNRAFWEEIARNVNPIVKRELEEILCLSYSHLPHHLRPCFLYIGGFPEDESIHASKLIKLWVAEGFSYGCSKNSEEQAEEYLEGLVKRYLVIVSSRKSNGKIKSCSLHDLVRDFCRSKASHEQFFHVVDGCDPARSLMIGGRRFSVNHSSLSDIWSPTIQTILCFQTQNTPSWLAFLGSSKLLKVLNAVTSNHEEFPFTPHVLQLFHLRYLVLIGSFSVPSAISSLVNLQTLIIHPTIRKRNRNWRDYANAPSFSLPLEIWKMPELRHIVLYNPYILPQAPDGSDTPLENLQSLMHVRDIGWNEKMVKMLPNVKKLGLVRTLNKDDAIHHPKNLLRLEKLQVTTHSFTWWRQAHTFPMTLKKLSLVGGGIPWVDMAAVGSLPNLEVLKLLDKACVGERWRTRDGEFSNLKMLLIVESLLEDWTTESNPLPRLERLVLHSCRCLRNIPQGIGEVPTLELIEVAGYCRSTLLESLEQIKEEQESYGNETLQVRTIDCIQLPEEEDKLPLYKELPSAEREIGEAETWDVWQPERTFISYKINPLLRTALLLLSHLIMYWFTYSILIVLISLSLYSWYM